MLSAKPNPGWDDAGKMRYILRKRQQPLAVYDLSKRPANTFFSYLGKFTLLCVVALLTYTTILWVLHGRHSAILAASNDAETAVNPADSTPTISEEAAKPEGPKLGYVATWNVTASGASISWSTTVPANTGLKYGVTRALPLTVEPKPKLEVAHGVTLTGLKSGTTYYFAAESADKDGLVGTSSTGSFKTLAVASAPAISKVVVVPGKNNQVQISWATSVPAFSYVQVGSTTAYNRFSTRTELTTKPRPSIAWVPSGTVHYQLVSTDSSGNQTISPDYTFIEP